MISVPPKPQEEILVSSAHCLPCTINCFESTGPMTFVPLCLRLLLLPSDTISELQRSFACITGLAPILSCLRRPPLDFSFLLLLLLQYSHRSASLALLVFPSTLQPSHSFFIVTTGLFFEALRFMILSAPLYRLFQLELSFPAPYNVLRHRF